MDPKKHTGSLSEITIENRAFAAMDELTLRELLAVRTESAVEDIEIVKTFPGESQTVIRFIIRFIIRS